MVLLLLAACAGKSTSPALPDPSILSADDADDLLVVDCLLPGRVRKLGSKFTYLEPPRPTRTTALLCEIRGGEYVAYDRANYQTALAVWLTVAEGGDPQAQNYVGEIHERGLGRSPDYIAAADWYRKAADQGYRAAQVNLGSLYERGLGVDRDLAEAMAWYRRAAGGAAVEFVPTRGDAPAAQDETVVLPPPRIEMLDPPIVSTRGIDLSSKGLRGPRIGTGPGRDRRVVEGRVDAAAGLRRVVVNGRPVRLEGETFRTEIPVARQGSQVSVRAVDRQGREGELHFVLVPESPVLLDPREAAAPEDPASAALPDISLAVDFGKYHALVIGNERYPHFPRLATPVYDAEAVAQVLRTRYGFQVRMLVNATRFEILAAMNELAATLEEDDNLLVYYAGHGTLDEGADEGYWLPVDARPDDRSNWLSTRAITDHLNRMRARHVLAIVDSCYSGVLSRAGVTRLRSVAGPAEQLAWWESQRGARVRLALTSGGEEPVLDEGGAGHSVFARVLLEVLRSNGGVLDATSLYLSLRSRVDLNAREAGLARQRPQLAPIPFATHEGGDFLLVPQRAS